MQLQVKKMGLDHLNVDVLVVGSGAAGLRLLLLQAKKVQRCVSFQKAAALNFHKLKLRNLCRAQEKGSSESHRNGQFRRKGINQQELVDVLVEEGPMRLQNFSDGEFMRSPSGCLFAKGRPLVWGEEIVRCLMIRARTLEFNFGRPDGLQDFGERRNVGSLHTRL